MKAWTSLSLFVLLTLNAFSSANTRVYQIGSNPFYSWISYPQDVMQWGGNFMYYYPRYEQVPWWGDIDEPTNKPNATTYTTTGNKEIDGDAYFEHSGKIHSIGNQLGYAHWFRENLVTSFDLDYDVDALRNRAEGKLTDEDNISHIPFDYSLRHTINRLYLNGIMGFKVRYIPVGFKLRFGFENTLALKQDFYYTKNDQAYSSDRTVWGWSTEGCNHIFGSRNAEGDAWLQREYAQGPMFMFDLQGGMTLPRVKLGTLFRYKFGHQDQYAWEMDENASTSLDSTFMGDYQKSDMARKTRDATMLLYGNINWRKGKRYALNTFALLGYEGITSGDALSENLEIEDDAKEKARNVFVEFNPNINLLLGEHFHYIDAALLLKYSYNRLNNTYERWVGGGTQETYWNTSVNGEDENIWERFSYANENFFDVGADISAMFPLVNMEARFLGFGFMLLFDTRFTFQTKYYGNNTDDGTEITFTVDNRRENFKREIWFNTALTLQYMRMPFHIRFEIYEPLLYSLMPRTRVTDDEGKEVFYEHKTQPLWLSQRGFGVGLYFSYDMTLPFLR